MGSYVQRVPRAAALQQSGTSMDFPLPLMSTAAGGKDTRRLFGENIAFSVGLHQRAQPYWLTFSFYQSGNAIRAWILAKNKLTISCCIAHMPGSVAGCFKETHGLSVMDFLPINEIPLNVKM